MTEIYLHHLMRACVRCDTLALSLLRCCLFPPRCGCAGGGFGETTATGVNDAAVDQIRVSAEESQRDKAELAALYDWCVWI